LNFAIEAEILCALEKDPLNRQQRALEFKRELTNAANLSWAKSGSHYRLAISEE